MRQPIAFEDSPHLDTMWNFRPCKVRYDFETYVVGVKGPEGMKYQTEQTFAAPIVGLTDITVYAGVGWGATFTHIRSDLYHRVTWLRRDIAPSDHFKLAVATRFADASYNPISPS
jgi:hypothetical protein